MLFFCIFPHLLAFITIGGFYKLISAKAAQMLALSASVIAVLFSVISFYQIIFERHVLTFPLFQWINVGALSISWSLFADSVTVVMLVVVNVTTLLVQIYSIGYMSHDDNMPKYMSFLSLFAFFMLLLVTSDNLLQLFVGWEGVGLCSYLLIGYWYRKEAASSAGMKAFIVNRVADIFFVIGLITIYFSFDTLVFSEVFAKVPLYLNQTINFSGLNFGLLDFICIMLFLGCMGKSAQILFHTWLPDAMEGPTPVSALIHAATMVTAGVFLVVRCSPLFEESPLSLEIITLVGVITAFFAATIALVQNDIKKIIAYSTCSQLGYMFLACGVSAYPAAMFHLITHAHFKSLLFLGAGAVIHAMNGEQDITKMGGLRKKIPGIYFAMLVGSLALSGVFPFSGFFSKDIILEAALIKGTSISNIAYFIGMVTVALTAFYSFRLMVKVFHMPSHNSTSLHESPKTMLVPLFILSFASTFSGMVCEYLFHIVDSSLAFWRGSIYIYDSSNPLVSLHNLPVLTKSMPLILAVGSIALTYIFYKLPHFWRCPKYLLAMMKNGYYFDAFYDYCFTRNFKKISDFLYKKIDANTIDHYGPNSVVRLLSRCSGYIKNGQNGLVSQYALVMLIGVIFIITWYFIIY